MPKKCGKRRIKLGRRTAALLDVPEEALTGEIRLVLNGRGRCLVENHDGVFECGEEKIRLRCGRDILRIEGTELVLMDISPERAFVSGGIRSIEFEN